MDALLSCGVVWWRGAVRCGAVQLVSEMKDLKADSKLRAEFERQLLIAHYIVQRPVCAKLVRHCAPRFRSLCLSVLSSLRVSLFLSVWLLCARRRLSARGGCPLSLFFSPRDCLLYPLGF